MELWDAYDETGRKIAGVSLVRGQPVPEGMYHLVCEILVRHRDGEYLLMQRDPRKAHGGMWEASAGGSVLQNETAPEAARRELKEETGIDAEDLQERGRIFSSESRTIYAEFFCLTGGPKDGIVLQEGETVDYRWVSREELQSMIDSGLVVAWTRTLAEELRP